MESLLQLRTGLRLLADGSLGGDLHPARAVATSEAHLQVGPRRRSLSTASPLMEKPQLGTRALATEQRRVELVQGHDHGRAALFVAGQSFVMRAAGERADPVVSILRGRRAFGVCFRMYSMPAHGCQKLSVLVGSNGVDRRVAHGSRICPLFSGTARDVYNGSGRHCRQPLCTAGEPHPTLTLPLLAGSRWPSGSRIGMPTETPISDRYCVSNISVHTLNGTSASVCGRAIQFLTSTNLTLDVPPVWGSRHLSGS